MLSLIFSLLLISDYEAKWPDPYFGVGFNPFKERNPSGITYHRKFFDIGFPFQIVDPDVKVTDPFLPVFLVLPEIAYNTDIFQFSLAAGYEGGIPLMYRSNLSAFIWGAQAGIYYNLFLKDGLYTNEFGDRMNASDKTSFAGLLNVYLGPQFDLNEKYALRFLVDQKFIGGKIAYHTFRSEFSEWWGLITSFNLQLKFL